MAFPGCFYSLECWFWCYPWQVLFILARFITNLQKPKSFCLSRIWHRQPNKPNNAGGKSRVNHGFVNSNSKTIWYLQFTPAEAEVGLLRLKGLSHAEIANLRNSSERTIPDQARAIYRKSGLAWYAELSAFFWKISCCHGNNIKKLTGIFVY